MKKYVILLFLICLSVQGFSQDWITDINKAKELASQNDKKIVLVFSGSDWCAPCMKLDKSIFKTEDFQSFATNNYIMLKADFPRRKKNALSSELQKHNNLLAEKYNPRGFFPLVVVMDSSGNVLGETGYQKISPNQFIELLESF
mgnify:CR=1 FL=1